MAPAGDLVAGVRSTPANPTGAKPGAPLPPMPTLTRRLSVIGVSWWGERSEMKQASRRKRPEDTSFGDKLLRSAQQARDWVQGKPVRVRVTYVPAPQVDVRKLRARMGLSQTQFAAKFGFSLDSLQNWEQGHRQPEGPARTLLVVIAKNPKAVEEALGSS